MDEKFSIKKLFCSFGSPLAWVKSGSIGLKIIVILFISFTVYRAFFMPTQKQNNDITVEDGGVLHLQQSDNKRRLEPFVEIYTFGETGSRYGGGMRAGVRW